jgi:type II secretory pathway pseudopilin PulG
MIDFTQVVIAIVGGILSIAGSVFLAWLSSHMKDQAAAATIGSAVNNALGAVQQAVDAGITTHPLQATIPGITPAAAAGVQYVLDNAGPELSRFADVTPSSIAEKIDAKIGLAKLAPLAIIPATTSATTTIPLVK